MWSAPCFYAQLRGGARTTPDGDPQRGHRVGFRAGLAYQRARFFLLFHGYNVEHFEDVRQRSTGGQGAVGWELTPGLSLSLQSDVSVLSRFGRDAVSQSTIALTYVHQPTGRAQQLRVADPRRGEGWFWHPAAYRQRARP